MFDDLRKSANEQSAFPDDRNADLEPLLNGSMQAQNKGLKLNGLNFLGLSAFQRFVLSALLFLLVFILGTMLLMITSSAMSF
jgi:hypothetical protein